MLEDDIKLAKEARLKNGANNKNVCMLMLVNIIL